MHILDVHWSGRDSKIVHRSGRIQEVDPGIRTSGIESFRRTVRLLQESTEFRKYS